MRPPAARVHLPALGLALGVALGLPLLASCGGDDGPQRTDDGGSSTGEEPPPRPLFSEPVSGMLLVPTTRSDDLTLKVHDVLPGRTELLIDERSLGFLGPDAIAGRLEAEQLTLHLRGAMVAGRHEMLMRTIDSSGLTESAVIDVELIRDLEIVPSAGPLSTTSLGARHLLAQGSGNDALLVVLDDDGAEPIVHLLPRGDDGWDVDGRRTIAVPGLVLDADARVLPVTALRSDRTADDPGRVRVAWRVGAPGVRIDVLDAAWDEASPERPPSASLSLEHALAGAVAGTEAGAEWAELGRPWLMPDLLMAELWAPLDVEMPRPGDHVLVWTRVHDDPDELPEGIPLLLDPVQRASVRTERVDLDRLGTALDPVSAEAGGPPMVTIRADQHQPLVLEHDPAGGVRVRPTVVDGRDRSFSFADLPLATVLGAFGSRTVAGITMGPTGRIRVAGIDDFGDGGVNDSSLGPEDLPPLDTVTGELATSSVGGLAVFLMPFGAEAVVHAVYFTGNAGVVAALDEIVCNAVALADRANASGAVPLACAFDGQLQLGTLVPTAP